MKILSQNHSYNPNFTAFNVSYNSAEGLAKMPSYFLSSLLKLGRNFEKTEFIDIELLSNLKLRIKEKGNVCSSIREPITAYKPKANESRIQISGIYDGADCDTKTRGSLCRTYIDYISPNEALKGYARIKNTENKIEKIGVIAKEMERSKVIQAEKEFSALDRRKVPFHQVLLNKYGDIVKEWE